MLIVQISDLHCTHAESFLKDKLAMAVSEINHLNPDVVIVAGDLTENGFSTEFKMAKYFIEKIECSKKIVIMGNHDARFTGYLLFEKFFGPSMGFLEDENYSIAYINTARADRDAGRVSRDQLEFLKKKFMNTQNKFNILVMHHHLIPVPDTGLEMAIVEDAGDVLKVLANLNIKAVLSGHRHRPWRWRLNDTEFLFTGAVSTIRLRGFFENCYNIIRLSDHGIDAKLKIVGGPTITFDEVVSGSYKI